MTIRSISLKSAVMAGTFAAVASIGAPLAVAQEAATPGGAPAAPVAAVAGDQAGVQKLPDLNSIIQSGKTKANLTIHKFKGDPVEGGQQGIDTTVNLPGLDGAEFTIQKINNLDPRNMQDWVAYSKLNPKDIQPAQLGPETKVTTQNGGVATFEGDLGFYLVKETPVPGRSSISPTLVALPMTHPDRLAWNYDVHIHPKNQILTVKKQVMDMKTVMGQDVDYTITGDVPAPYQDGSNFNRYVLVDDYDETKLAPKQDTLKVAIDGEDATGKFTVENVNGMLKVALNDQGLETLTQKRKANPDAKVTVTLKATVTGDIDNLKQVENKVYLFSPFAPGTIPPDTPDRPNENPNTPHSEVESKYGNINIHKTASNDHRDLSGAVFQLFRCEDNSNTIKEGPLTVGGKSEWTTDAKGAATIKGVQLNTFANGAAVADDDYDYCLVEKKAPEGFELLPKPINFDMTDDVNFTYAANIENIPKNGGFELPRTGGVGMYAIIAALAAGFSALGFRSLRAQKGKAQI